ncbi:hypothetical protein EGW08_009185, partial [Elysia chlorotica]
FWFWYPKKLISIQTFFQDSVITDADWNNHDVWYVGFEIGLKGSRQHTLKENKTDYDPTACSFNIELNRVIPITYLALHILCENGPVQMIFSKTAPDVKSTGVPQQPSKKFHAHKI